VPGLFSAHSNRESFGAARVSMIAKLTVSGHDMNSRIANQMFRTHAEAIAANLPASESKLSSAARRLVSEITGISPATIAKTLKNPFTLPASEDPYLERLASEGIK